MASPIKPQDITDLGLTGNLCQRFLQLLRTRADFKTFLTWILGSDGEISDAAVSSMADRLNPVGAIILWGGTQLPSASWLVCNGQLALRSAYPLFFQRYGTTFGAGDGTNTFSLPDLQAKVAYGVGPSAPLGSNTGSNDVTLLVANLPAHTHDTVVREINVDGESGGVAGTVHADTATYPASPSSETLVSLSGPAGAIAASFSVIPRNLALYYIIKVK